jgi:Ca-activated chloride channel family protein
VLDKRNPEVESPLSELHESLRTAVEKARAAPPPPEALERALNRAQKLGPPKPQPWRRFLKPAVAAAVAACLYLGLSAWFSPKDPRTSAENNLHQLGLAIQQRSESARFAGGVTLADGESNTVLLLRERLSEGEQLQRLDELGVMVAREGKELPHTELPLAPKPPRELADLFKEAESYDRIVENVFLSAHRVPLSTFSIDVHSASYSNVRRFLFQEQRLPPADAVRVAELINYFPYTYAEPRGQHPVAFTTNITECPWNPQHHLVRVALKGKTIDLAHMPPRNLVFLIDTSGSMAAENRLPLLKSSLKMLVDELTDKDRVAIVTYAGTAGLALPATPGTDTVTIKKAIDDLNAEGSTNGGEGIVLAYRLARENFIKGGLNRVILGTDGDFNVGVTKEEDLIRLIEEQRQSGVFLTVLGFGMGNLKDAMMEKLAHHGSGHYAYIDSLMEAKKIFVDQGAALLTIARDVKLQVEFNPQRVGAYRLIGYENRMLADKDFHDDTKHAGSIGTGHTVTALYEIVPAGLPVPEPGKDRAQWQVTPKPAEATDRDDWLTVRMRYKDPEAEQSRLVEQKLTGPVVRWADAPTDFRFAAAVASFGLMLRDSPYRGGLTYAGVRELAQDSLGADRNGHRHEFLTLVDTAATIARKQKE